MVIMDVDGVLSDGRIILGGNGSEYKAFDAHDGFGIDRASRKGMKFAIVTGRTSRATSMRARELGVAELHQGIKDKAIVIRQVGMKHGLRNSELCYIGDDDFDLPALSWVGLSAAPCDAMPNVLGSVDYVTRAHGGRGAVREVVDMILTAQNLLEAAE
jgi:3-deoxy-D-manno-octulosonate 8-phosphate phosphatase (KDO 8-P phosphatase)